MMDYLRQQGNTALRLVLLGAGTLASVSCGDEIASQPIDGTILVGVTTVGSDFDQNGYTVLVNNAQADLLETSQDTAYVDVEAGSYQVALTGIAANCSTTPGENPLAVEVVPADTVNAEFEVTCDPPGGGGPPPP